MVTATKYRRHWWQFWRPRCNPYDLSHRDLSPEVRAAITVFDEWTE